ncbi:MAG: CoA ester lyase [Desulfobacterales bacterium]|nr:MAG: CoA ester lyase [Desulfobacterales bacterium]
MKKIEIIRTALFVPGNRPDRVDKAVNTAADVVIIDLEDAVPYMLKAETRPLVREKLFQHKNRNIFVRVNGLDTEFFQEDLDELVVESLDCIIIPKIEHPEHIREANRLLFEAEKKKGVLTGNISIIALIESALGVERAFQIVSEKTEPNRLFTIAFGAADFALDMGIEMTKTGDEISYPRTRLAVACRAAGLEPPLDTPFMIDLKDMEALEADAKRAKQFGFQGKLCIHPNQVEICNKIFSPTREEIKYAERVIQAFKEAESRGVAAIQVDGKFVDYPVMERSKRILRIAEKIS